MTTETAPIPGEARTTGRREKKKNHPEGWMQPIFVGKPGPFHLNGPAPRPYNENCSISKTTGRPCRTCKCPAFYVEVERRYHPVMIRQEITGPKSAVKHNHRMVEGEEEDTPRIRRVICANCRKRTHEDRFGQLVEIGKFHNETFGGQREYLARRAIVDGVQKAVDLWSRP